MTDVYRTGRALGAVREVIPTGAGRDLVIEAPAIAAELAFGESVAVNGCCLTVVAHDAETCRFQAGPETLRRTNLGDLNVPATASTWNGRCASATGSAATSFRATSTASAASTAMLSDGDWVMFWFTCPPELAVQMVSKGSVAVDGVSLTLVDVEDGRFSVALIPHTLAQTTLGFKRPGDPVNLETDLLASTSRNTYR